MSPGVQPGVDQIRDPTGDRLHSFVYPLAGDLVEHGRMSRKGHLQSFRHRHQAVKVHHKFRRATTGPEPGVDLTAATREPVQATMGNFQTASYGTPVLGDHPLFYGLPRLLTLQRHFGSGSLSPELGFALAPADIWTNTAWLMLSVRRRRIASRSPTALGDCWSGWDGAQKDPGTEQASAPFYLALPTISI